MKYGFLQSNGNVIFVCKKIQQNDRVVECRRLDLSPNSDLCNPGSLSLIFGIVVFRVQRSLEYVVAMFVYFFRRRFLNQELS